MIVFDMMYVWYIYLIFSHERSLEEDHHTFRKDQRIIWKFESANNVRFKSSASPHQ